MLQIASRELIQDQHRQYSKIMLKQKPKTKKTGSLSVVSIKEYDENEDCWCIVSGLLGLGSSVSWPVSLFK